MTQKNKNCLGKFRCAGMGLLMMGMVVWVGCSPPVTVPPSTPAPVPGLPIADAGFDQTVPVGSTVTLSGLRSADPNGRPLTFFWSEVSGPTKVVLSTPNAPVTTFVADVPGVYVFNLNVTNFVVGSSDDTVQITVE